METLRIIWAEIREIDTSRKAIRSFGWVVGTVLLGIGAFVMWRHDWQPTLAVYLLGGIGAGLVVLGLVVPRVLTPIYRVWMALAVVLGFVMTRVLLTLLYFLMITPIGLLMRLFGKDPMQRKLDKKAASYWIRKDYTDESPQRLEKYY